MKISYDRNNTILSFLFQEAIVLDDEDQIECHDDSMHYNREYYLNPQWVSTISVQ